MPVRGTKYGRQANKNTRISKKKRTIINRDMRPGFGRLNKSHRNRTIHNTPICPPGQRLVNGNCTDTSGVGFDGGTNNTLREVTDQDISVIGKGSDLTTVNNKEITVDDILRHFRNLKPYWITNNPRIETIQYFQGIVSIVPLSMRNVKSWVDIVNRAGRMTEPAGNSLILGLLNKIPKQIAISIDEYTNDDGDNQLYGDPIITIICLLALIAAMSAYLASP